MRPLRHEISYNRWQPRLLVLLLSVLTSSVLSFTQCTKADLSFFGLLDGVPDGYFPIGSKTDGKLIYCDKVEIDAVRWTNKSCRLQYKRSYLPDPQYFLPRLTKSLSCDTRFSRRLDRWVQTAGDITISRPSHNYSAWKQKKSVGRYIRFIAMLQYRLLAGSRNATVLINVDYEHQPNQLNFAWTDEVSSCRPPRFSGWSCAFEKFTTPKVWGHDDDGETRSFAGTDQVDILRIRETRKNSSVQFILFGKVVELYSRPSELVRNYSAAHIVSVNTPDKGWGGGVGPNRTRTFSTHSEFEAWMARGQSSTNSGPTLSLQARQGDSCEFVLEAEDPGLTRVWDRIPGAHRLRRKCFAPAVYMRAMRRLQRLYGIKTVLLSTDSQSMVDLALKEGADLHWVFLNISRQVFSYNSTGSDTFIEFRYDDANEQVLFSAVADLDLLKHGQVFLTTLSSTYSRLAFFAAAGHHAMVPPFISLDYPLSCESLDLCLGGRDRTAESIVIDPTGVSHHLDRHIHDWFADFPQAVARLWHTRGTSLYWAPS